MDIVTPGTLTWRPGEPCPVCGQVEPHQTVHDHNGLHCEPSKYRQGHARLAGELLFGLQEAAHLNFDEAAIRARIAELESIQRLGEPIYYTGQST